MNPPRPLGASLLTALRRGGRSAPAGRLRAIAAASSKTHAHKGGIAEHRPYVVAQNLVSRLTDELVQLPALKGLTELLQGTDEHFFPDGYPGGPPFSAFTKSFYSSWQLFDAALGPAMETICSCILDASAEIGLPGAQERILRTMQASRMGFYIAQPAGDCEVTLQELITEHEATAIVVSGYRPQRDELWYARVLPPPFAGGSPIVFTTPYICRSPGASVWETYLRSVSLDALSPGDGYALALKYGRSPTFWLDFVDAAYRTHASDAVWLEGLPGTPGGEVLAR